VIVLATSIVVALAEQRTGSGGPVAARVGAVTVSASAVEREVAAIDAQPTYVAALGRTSTMALAAPLDPKAIAAANGDPDDLRITFSAVGSATRSYTAADLKAGVLTRLIYVAALRQLLALHHVAPSAVEVADGRQEARLHAGVDPSGASLFDRLPAWYQTELALRGADVEALIRFEVGTGGVTDADVQAAYQKRLASDFTTVCLRSVVVSGADEATGRAELQGGGPGTRDDGCAPLGQWSPDVATVIAAAPAGTVGPSVQRGAKVALLEVTRRIEIPLSAVAVDVRAGLLSGYTDLINKLVGDELSVLPISVAPEYGTYENADTLHEVLPPDALAPPTPASTVPSFSPPTTRPRTELDPFD
jgi:hypothetical protein